MVCFALLEFTRPQFGLTVNLTCNTALHYFGLLLKSSLACAAWVWPSLHNLNQPQKSSIVWPAPYWFASLASFTDLPYNTFREMSAWIALLVWEEGHAAWRKDPFADKTIPHVNSTPIFKPITLPIPTCQHRHQDIPCVVLEIYAMTKQCWQILPAKNGCRPFLARWGIQNRSHVHLVLSGEVLVIAVEQVRTMPALRRAVVFPESGMQGFEEEKIS